VAASGGQLKTGVAIIAMAIQIALVAILWTLDISFDHPGRSGLDFGSGIAVIVVLAFLIAILVITSTDVLKCSFAEQLILARFPWLARLAPDKEVCHVGIGGESRDDGAAAGRSPGDRPRSDEPQAFGAAGHDCLAGF